MRPVLYAWIARAIASMRPWDWVPGIAPRPPKPRLPATRFNEALGLGPRDCMAFAVLILSLWRFNEALGLGPRDCRSRSAITLSGPRFNEALGLGPRDWSGAATGARGPRGRFNEALGLGPRDCADHRSGAAVGRVLQ